MIMGLHRSHPACDNYEPNWEKWDASGQMCTGFGAGPDCKNCGQDEHQHQLKSLAPEWEPAPCPSCGHPMDVHAAHTRLKDRLACFACTEGSCPQ